METLKERAKKFATRNYLNSDDEIVASIVDREVYENALVVAETIVKEMIKKGEEWIRTVGNEEFTNSTTSEEKLDIIVSYYTKAMKDIYGIK